ncbi:MAG TPA: hypothetical protein VHT27_10435, partial [Solirubrobacteraceae bacterium]|nr:hypothetical protein [Solirubrobacteraceae bacterium]
MLLALGTAAVVLVVLVWELARPGLRRALAKALERHAEARARRLRAQPYDPGRELRAEQRARDLLRSCVDREDWEMYRDLGFMRVYG